MAKQNPTREEVTAAYREVLGRNPDKGGLEAYMKSGLTGDKLKKNLAESKEASRRKGLDVTKYGVKVRSVDKLKSGYKETFEKYKDRFGWDENKITNSIFEEIKGVTHLFKTDEGREQWERGNITLDSGSDGKLSVVFKPEAVQALGTDLNIHIGGSVGTSYLFPTKVNINGELQNVKLKNDRFTGSQAYMVDGKDTGYSFTQRIPDPSSGLLGAVNNFLTDDLGMSEDIAATTMFVAGISLGGGTGALLTAGKFLDEVAGIKEGYFATDPLNFYSGITYGTEGYERNIEGAASIFDTDYETAARGQMVGRAVAKVAANFIPGVGNLVSLGLSLSEAANEASVGNESWGEAAVSAGVSLVAFGVSQLKVVQDLEGWAKIGYSALQSGATVAATMALKNPLTEKRLIEENPGVDRDLIRKETQFDWDKVGRAAAIGAAGGVLNMYSPEVYGVSVGSTALNVIVAETPEERAGAIASGVLGFTAGITGVGRGGQQAPAYTPNILDPIPEQSGNWWSEVVATHRPVQAQDIASLSAQGRGSFDYGLTNEFFNQGPVPMTAIPESEQYQQTPGWVKAVPIVGPMVSGLRSFGEAVSEWSDNSELSYNRGIRRAGYEVDPRYLTNYFSGGAARELGLVQQGFATIENINPVAPGVGRFNPPSSRRAVELGRERLRLDAVTQVGRVTGQWGQPQFFDGSMEMSTSEMRYFSR